MKQVIAIAIAFAGIAAQAQSSYDMLIPKRVVQSADIGKVTNISQNPIFPEIGTTGQLVIDRRMKMVSINLVARGLQDTTFFSPVAQIQLRLNSITKDEGCNTVTYQASTDVHQLGRNYETVTIVDNTKNICETLIPLAPTEITYELREQRNQTYTVRMEAGALVREVIE